MPPRRRRQATAPETPEGNAEEARGRETRVRVRYRQGVAAVNRSYRAGEIVEVDQAAADTLVAAGWAEVVDE